MTQQPRATIHLGHIADNWRTIDSLYPNAKTAAVVKANAYGLGLAQVAPVLHDAGCDVFFVAYSFEGEALRKIVGPHALIFVLNGPSIDEADLYEKSVLTVVVNTPGQYQTWHNWRASGYKIAYALHFDTGMNRLGLPVADAAKIAEATEPEAPVLIMSHLSSSECAGNETSLSQLELFKTVCAYFPDVPASLSNSGGVFAGDEFVFDLLRPGFALYGGGYDNAPTILKTSLTLEAPILSVHIGRAGESVGYGATRKFDDDTLLATVALGYADGIPRSGSDKLSAYIAGIECKIVGRISMDLITIDVSKAHQHAKAGVFVEFIGPNANLNRQAEFASTIGYELLTGLGHRVKRTYET